MEKEGGDIEPDRYRLHDCHCPSIWFHEVDAGSTSPLHSWKRLRLLNTFGEHVLERFSGRSGVVIAPWHRVLLFPHEMKAHPRSHLFSKLLLMTGQEPLPASSDPNSLALALALTTAISFISPQESPQSRSLRRSRTSRLRAHPGISHFLVSIPHFSIAYFPIIYINMISFCRRIVAISSSLTDSLLRQMCDICKQ